MYGAFRARIPLALVASVTGDVVLDVGKRFKHRIDSRQIQLCQWFPGVYVYCLELGLSLTKPLVLLYTYVVMQEQSAPW